MIPAVKLIVILVFKLLSFKPNLTFFFQDNCTEKHEDEVTKEQNTMDVVTNNTINGGALVKTALSKCDMFIFSILFVVAGCMVYYFRY